jgi:hypothetical protein
LKFFKGNKFFMTGSTSAGHENPPFAPFTKGGLGGFESYWFEAGFFWLRPGRAVVSVVKF